MKKTKTEVNYGRGEGTTRCGYCTMFRMPLACTAVKGSIQRQGVCDLFEAKEGRAT